MIEFLARDDFLQLCVLCFKREKLYCLLDFAFNEEWVESGVPIAVVMEV